MSTVSVLCVWTLLLVVLAAAAGPNSCVGQCTKGWSQNCWCNDSCEAHQNCCADYQEVCGGAPATLQLLANDYPEAVCLDGSSAGFYHRQANSSKWLIYFQGGGWCYDQSCNPDPQKTIANCQERATTSLGSSKAWGSTMAGLSGSLSASKLANPVFWDYNLVYVPYCDGTSFSSNSSIGGLQFRGKPILHAVIDSLKGGSVHPSILDAERVVLSGGSAGASAVYYHSDSISDQLGLADGTVVAMPDAGFFLDLPDTTGIDCWPNQMRSVFNLSNSYPGLHAGCLKKYPDDPAKCMFPQYYSELIRTPTFVIQSLYDSSEMWYTLRLNCCPGKCSGYAKCTGAQLKAFEALRNQHMVAWEPLVSRPQNGVWAIACIDHTTTWSKWTDSTWEVPAGGSTMSEAVQQWLSGTGNNRFEDKASWPHNSPCAMAMQWQM